MRKLLRGFVDLRSEATQSTLVFPVAVGAAIGAAEQWNEVIAQLDTRTELATQFIQANLGRVGPDTEQISKIFNRNYSG